MEPMVLLYCHQFLQHRMGIFQKTIGQLKVLIQMEFPLQAHKQAPRAEFDSMSNLSSNSSNTSISNNNISQPNQKTSNIPLFQELDPLNKKGNSPLNLKNFNDNRNRSPMLNNPNGLDSSLSSMNSSNSSLFNNSRN
ncbi:hypothetical protein BLA29_001234, partial [Euroglyphus maynei]